MTDRIPSLIERTENDPREIWHDGTGIKVGVGLVGEDYFEVVLDQSVSIGALTFEGAILKMEDIVHEKERRISQMREDVYILEGRIKREEGIANSCWEVLGEYDNREDSE